MLWKLLGSQRLSVEKAVKNTFGTGWTAPFIPLALPDRGEYAWIRQELAVPLQRRPPTVLGLIGVRIEFVLVLLARGGNADVLGLVHEDGVVKTSLDQLSGFNALLPCLVLQILPQLLLQHFAPCHILCLFRGFYFFYKPASFGFDLFGISVLDLDLGVRQQVVEALSFFIRELLQEQQRTLDGRTGTDERFLGEADHRAL